MQCRDLCQCVEPRQRETEQTHERLKFKSDGWHSCNNANNRLRSCRTTYWSDQQYQTQYDATASGDGDNEATEDFVNADTDVGPNRVVRRHFVYMPMRLHAIARDRAMFFEKGGEKHTVRTIFSRCLYSAELFRAFVSDSESVELGESAESAHARVFQ